MISFPNITVSSFEQPSLQSLELSNNFHTTVDVLRLDQLHPVVSGNKWYKLKYYLQDAAEQGKHTIVTFGGAYSNHIVAAAAAAQQHGFKTVGIIRGERPRELSPTLKDAQDFGMQLLFMSRNSYQKKSIPDELNNFCHSSDAYIIPEGGYGKNGVLGASEILDERTDGYSQVLCAVGTGTTAAGLVAGSQPGQSVIGVSVLKNNFQLEEEISSLLPRDQQHRFNLIHDYHFGGYARFNQELLTFMNRFYETTGLPTDFVYTAKLFFAVMDLITKGFFQHEKILVIHSGGLQGNRSLPKGTLIF